MGKKVAVVTGGAGFIGSHVVDLLLREGCEVRIIDDLSVGRECNLKQHEHDPNLRLEVRDIRQIEAGASLFKGADFVFHFAGIGSIVPSIESPSEYMSVNVQGTVRVLEAARSAGVRKFVYAASSSCYGASPPTPTSEVAPIDPQYPYALSKLQGEQAVFHWNRVYGLPVISIRIFNAYGPRSSTAGAYGAVLGVFLKQKLAGEPFTVVGDGNQRRDFLYVTDVAEAFWLAAQSEASGEVFNLGAGDPQSVNRLVELLGGAVTRIPRRPGEPDCTWADISKIRRVLGWKQKVSFEDGVARVLSEINDWSDAPLWTPQSIATVTQSWFRLLRD